MAKRSRSTSGRTLALFDNLPASSLSMTAKPVVRPSNLPNDLNPNDYEFDDDGLLREIVGAWVLDKHARLKRYVEISGIAVRKHWLKQGPAGATYIDLFSGPGRVRIRDSERVLDGSPLVAWQQAVSCNAPFTQVWVGDVHQDICAAVEARLKRIAAPVYSETGNALVTVERIVPKLNKYALHFAFLDPYNLAALPFEVIRKLAVLKRMDILIHISTQDLNRNLRKYIEKSPSPLDTFAPCWREHVDVERPDHYVRAKIFEHWRGLLQTVGMGTTEAAELVTGGNNQPLYWLAFAARHGRALEFWEKIRNIEPVTQLGFL